MTLREFSELKAIQSKVLTTATVTGMKIRFKRSFNQPIYKELIDCHFDSLEHYDSINERINAYIQKIRG